MEDFINVDLIKFYMCHNVTSQEHFYTNYFFVYRV